MIPTMPALGIRFDVGKIESGGYGLECWKVFWRAVDVKKLGGGLLFDGDTNEENVFCIAIQSSNSGIFSEIRTALEQSSGFQKMAASPMFVENDRARGEPLSSVGQIDLAGNLVGEGYWARIALDTIRAEHIIKADSLEEAREQVKSRSPEGLNLPSEQVISEGGPDTVRTPAQTGEDEYFTILREAYGVEAARSTHSQQDAKEGSEELLAASKIGAVSTRMPEPSMPAQDAVTPHLSATVNEGIAHHNAGHNAKALADYSEAVLGMLRKYQSKSSLYFAPNIPSNKLTNASSSCHISSDEQVLALIDCTILGSAKDCILFGTKGLSYHHQSAKPVVGTIPYSDFPRCNFVKTGPWSLDTGMGMKMNTSGGRFSGREACEMLNELKRSLSNSEAKKSQAKHEGFSSTASAPAALSANSTVIQPPAHGPGRRKSSSNKKRKLGCGCSFAIIVVAFFLIALVGGWILKATGYKPPDTLDNHLNEYLNISSLQVGDLSRPYIRGKIVIIDKDNKQVKQLSDYIHSSEFDALLAKAPNEVGTIVWLEYKELVIGTYYSERTGAEAGHAYATTCYVTVINTSTNMIVGEKEITGPNNPPKKLVDGTDWHGGKPNDSWIVDYLDNLPRL